MLKSNANLDQIKERLNILDVVSTYIKLEKAGAQFRARCPFHSEKTPSFYVSPSRGTYHCFGCSEHGDIFGFTMKIEGIAFKDALRLLADKAGVTLTNFKKEEASNLIDILEASTLFFEHNLQNNAEAKKYLINRGLTENTIKNFRIGFAPNDWRQLYTQLKKSGYSDEEIVTSGVCIKHDKDGQSRLYDRFRSRIMFPISNASGKVVAYSGRIIGLDESKDGVAKYVNSPETPLYHKSSILFGYDKARLEIAKQKKVLVVEGQMDVCMAHQAGNINTVAISGTAFTPEHISILKRFAETVVLALDTDKAGYSAMLKSAGLALENDLEVEGIKLIDKDPAEMIKTDIDAWRKAVENSKPILTLIVEIIMEKEKIKPKQIQMLRKELFPLLRVVKSPLLKETFIKDIAETLSISKDIIKQETENVKTELELQIKKDKKQIPQIEIVTLLAQSSSAINFLTDEKVKSFYCSKINQYLSLQSEFVAETIPEEILNRESMILEQKSVDPEFKIEDHVKEVLGEFAKKLLIGLIENTKSKIREGLDMEENLKLVQSYTKMLNSLKQDLTYV